MCNWVGVCSQHSKNWIFFLWVFRFSPVSTIPSVLHTHHKDRWAQPGNLPQSSALLQIGVRWIQRYCSFSPFKGYDALVFSVCWVSLCVWAVGLTETSNTFLGAFAKLHKATISFVMSVCSSVRIEQLGSHWTDFHEIWYMSIFRKSVEKIQVSLRSDKNSGYFIRSPIHIFDNISLSSS